jgi:predicted transposase YdaD
MSERPHKWRDIAWKRAIADGARDAIEYFMPDLAADMDSLREVTAITDLELPLEGSDSDKDMRVSDVFLSVPLIGGEEWNVACFVEQQHENDTSFGARMFDSYVRLRAQRRPGRTTGFAIFTGNSKDVSSYTESCYGFEASINFRTFHLPSCSAKELKEDKRPFARVLYAGLLSLGSGSDAALREKYAWELLNMITEREYDKRRRKFILEFVNRIFRLSDPGISRELREGYRMRTISLEEYVREIDKEEARMEGMEEGKIEGKLEVVRSMLAKGLSAETIREYTGLDEGDILALS